jgi:PST family polysaccharide transporter
MRFKVIALIQILSMAAGVSVGVAMAFLNYGFWSLVGLNLTTPVVWCLLTWAASRWRPQIPTRGSGTGPLLRFGTHIAAGQFIYAVARGTDSLLIGRFFGADAIGLYSRASVLLTRPLEQAFNTLNTVFVPALSRLQAQPERYRRAFLQVYEAIALTTFPVTGLFLALAHPVTLVVLGPKWEKAAVIFAGFTMVALYFPLFNLSSWLFATQGRGKDSLVGFAIGSVIMVFSFVAGLPFGPAGVAIAYSASCLLIQLPVRYYIAGRSGPVSTTDLWLGFLRYLPLWLVVWGTTCLARVFVVNSAPLVQVVICAPVGLLAGAALIWIITPFRQTALSLIDALRTLRRGGRGAEV